LCRERCGVLGPDPGCYPTDALVYCATVEAVERPTCGRGARAGVPVSTREDDGLCSVAVEGGGCWIFCNGIFGLIESLSS